MSLILENALSLSKAGQSVTLPPVSALPTPSPHPVKTPAAFENSLIPYLNTSLAFKMMLHSFCKTVIQHPLFPGHQGFTLRSLLCLGSFHFALFIMSPCNSLFLALSVLPTRLKVPPGQGFGEDWMPKIANCRKE